MTKPSIHEGVVYGADRLCAEWLAERIGEPFIIREDTRALGVWDGKRLIAVVAYDGWNGSNVVASIVTEGPKSRWASRPVLRRLFAYPFAHASRITLLQRVGHWPAHKLAMALRFTPEATLRGAAHDGSDLLIWRMFRAECPWIRRADDGQEQ